MQSDPHEQRRRWSSILNRLSVGDAFGEDALISNDKRTANVVMTSDGALMRLSKRDFIQLLKEPTLKWVTIGEANKLVKRGRYG